MEYVQTEGGLNAVADARKGVPLLAVDTEAAGYHRSDDRICLLQLSTRARTWVIDTIALRDLRPLQRILGDAKTELVLHDADYDLRLLSRDHAMHVARLFDTKVAAQFLGEPNIGLADLVEKHLGVRLEKKHQRADWAQRPLSPELLEYAAEDTRHLPALRDHLLLVLKRLNREAWAEEEFRILEATRWSAPADSDAGFMKLKNARDLRPRQLACLRDLHKARDLPEHELPVRPQQPRRPPPDPEVEKLVDRLKAARDAAAARLGLDRGFLMPRQQLEQLARERPPSTRELAQLPGVRMWQVEAVGKELVETLSKANDLRART
jgi:ribonuclease D